MRTKMHRPPFMLTSADCSSKAPFPKTRSAFVASLQENSEQVKYFLTDYSQRRVCKYFLVGLKSVGLSNTFVHDDSEHC